MVALALLAGSIGGAERSRGALGELPRAEWLLAAETSHAAPRAQAEPVGRAGDAEVERLAGDDRVGTAITVSRARFPTAGAVVLARADDHADALVGAPLAADLGGPILLTPREGLTEPVRAELERLGATEVVLLGGELALSAEVERAVQDALGEDGGVRRVAGADRYETAAAAARELPAAEGVVLATGTDFPDALAAGPYAAATGRPLLLVAETSAPAATRGAVADRDPERLVVVGGEGAVPAAAAAELAAETGTAGVRDVQRLAGATRFETALAVRAAGVAEGLDPGVVWLATAFAFPDALAAGPAIAASGGALLLVDGSDLDRVAPVADALRAERAAITRVVLLGGPAAVTGDAVAQLTGLLARLQLPRGGVRLFPDFTVVAYYGGHQTPALGVLGEGTPAQAGQRLLAAAEPFATPQRPLLPAMELIATVATRGAGADGNYSSPSTDEQIAPYLAAAREIGALLLLDVQPGRSDFLGEVQRYERWLREPDVGIALDPEWRMGPGEVPGDRVGSVDAEEVNRVADYVAGIVRDGELPQKLFVVHQFTESMVSNRAAIVAPPELSVNFHLDGFGSRSAKLGTYDRLYPPERYSVGFKLFYDEDTNLFAPGDVLAFPRPPDLVTYQ